MSEDFAGGTWSYNYRSLAGSFDEKISSKVVGKMRDRYGKLISHWNNDINSEWICRTYMAAKLIMSATVHVTSAKHAEKTNLRVVVPYLEYYAAFSLCRAICLMVPEVEWKEGRIFSMGHGRAINGARDCLASFDKRYSKYAASCLNNLKANRELLSYRAPSSGDGEVEKSKEYLKLCRTLAEVAQFLSEILEQAIENNVSLGQFELEPKYVLMFGELEIESSCFRDDEDILRMEYIRKRIGRPARLQRLMTEGHVDDFFGAWASDAEGPWSYDPDEAKTIIFDIP